MTIVTTDMSKAKTVSITINTTSVTQVSVELVVDGKSFSRTSQSHVAKAQALLPLIHTLLSEHDLLITDVTSISVATGPGSFTGLRVGCTIANALGALLEIPVNGQVGIVTPTYT
jgi:tRNA threonylcarbamoyladenosine biosynthesis protein TsaB